MYKREKRCTFATIMKINTDFIEDEIYGDRLLVSIHADQRELSSNIRAARAILHSFPDVYIIINPHNLELGHKNPEYTIDSRLGDRKGIMSEKGVTAATVFQPIIEVVPVNINKQGGFSAAKIGCFLDTSKLLRSYLMLGAIFLLPKELYKKSQLIVK